MRCAGYITLPVEVASSLYNASSSATSRRGDALPARERVLVFTLEAHGSLACVAVRGARARLWLGYQCISELPSADWLIAATAV